MGETLPRHASETQEKKDMAQFDLLDLKPRAEAPTDPRPAWLALLVEGAEALAADLRENPAGRDYSPGAQALVRRAQALGEDLLEQVVLDGWLTRQQAARVLQRARMGAEVKAARGAPRAPKSPR
jgi:hypothetical protein